VSYDKLFRRGFDQEPRAGRIVAAFAMERAALCRLSGIASVKTNEPASLATPGARSGLRPKATRGGLRQQPLAAIRSKAHREHISLRPANRSPHSRRRSA
jgi:hypothetical protein